MMNKNGFTLIETLMAMAIISIGLLGLAALQMNALKNTTNAHKRSMIAIAVGEKIERYKAMSYGSIPIGNEDEDLPNGIERNTVVTTDAPPPQDHLKTFVVTATWQSRSITMTSSKSDIK